MTRSAHVLIIEDEEKTSDAIALYMRDAGYRVSVARDGAEGLRLARTTDPDILLLDMLLPKLSGAEVCRTLRAESSLPIIMLTALTTEQERVEGLDMGADDYVPKPFSPRELVSRVRAVLRRTRATTIEGPGRMSFDGLVLDRSTQQARRDGQAIELTPTEFNLLEVLMGAPARVFRRTELIERALGHHFEGDERTVDAHIKNLRQKIDDHGERPSWIRTVFGVGYQLVARDVAP